MVVRHSRALIVLLVAGMISCEPAEFGSGSAPADDTAQSSTVDATADPTAGPAAGPTAGPAADAVADRPGDETGTPPLTPDGWGAMRIGMTLEELTAVAGADANPHAVGGPDPERCDEFRPTEAPDGMIVMVEHGHLTRISIGARSDVKTERGFGIGDTAADIRAAYGTDVVSESHAYAPAPAEYITIWKTPPPAPDARGILYDIGADGRVSHVRAGGPSIQYYEGCV